MSNLLSTLLIWGGIILFCLGILCFICCKTFASKLLVTSIMDACGLMTFMLGAMLHYGLSVDGFKLLLILITVLIISPITSHEIARLAKKCGQDCTGDCTEGNDEEEECL